MYIEYDTTVDSVVTFDTRTTDIAQSRNIAQLHYQIHNCDEILAVSLYYVPQHLPTITIDVYTVDDPLPFHNIYTVDDPLPFTHSSICDYVICMHPATFCMHDSSGLV